MIIKNVVPVIIIIIMIITPSVEAQKKLNDKLTHQITIDTDNDVYMLNGSDGYYTNGMFINFSKLGKNNKNDQGTKTIYNYAVGHKIFTPGIREVYVVTEIDRPITGYLYGKFSISKFTRSNKFINYGLSLGTIGNNAQGEKVLKLYHPFIKINSDFWDWVWKYQLKNEIGINLHGSFAKSLINYQSSPFFQVTPQTDLTLGTTFTNISQSVIFQVGKQNSMSESSYWGARLSNSENRAYRREFFFFYHPQVSYQLYNATVQGGMLRSDKGDIVSNIEPLVVSNELGIIGSINRYSASFHITFLTKEATLQEKNHSFGKIQLAYRFK